MLSSINNEIFYREWLIKDAKACIILVHGLGAYTGRFFELGPTLSENRYNVFAIEQRGFGEYPSLKGHINNFKKYTKDITSLIDHVKNENPGKKIFVLGESMGGLITLDFSIHHQDMIDGIILISPAVKDKLAMGILKRIEIFISSIFNPKKYFDAFFKAEMFTRDSRMIERINKDPLEVRNLTAKFYISILKAIIYVNMHPKKIKLPLLMLLSGKDKMISAEAAESYFHKIRSKDKTLKWFPEMYHALYIDKDREKVFKDLIAWIERHL